MAQYTRYDINSDQKIEIIPTNIITSSAFLSEYEKTINKDFKYFSSVPENVYTETVFPDEFEEVGLNVSTDVLTFDEETSLLIFNIENTTDQDLNGTIESNRNGINVTPTSGTNNSTIEAIVDRSNLPNGVYTGEIVVISDEQTYQINTTLVIANAEEIEPGPDDPILQISTNALHFSETTNSLTFEILNVGGGDLNGNITKKPSQNEDGMTITPTEGINNRTINVTSEVGELSEGAYNEIINVNSDGGIKEINASLVIGEEPQDEITEALQVSTNTLDFGETTSSLTFDIINNADENLNGSLNSNNSWFQFSPTSGSNNETINVTVNRDNLSDQEYNGIIDVYSISGAHQESKRINLTLLEKTTLADTYTNFLDGATNLLNNRETIVGGIERSDMKHIAGVIFEMYNLQYPELEFRSKEIRADGLLRMCNGRIQLVDISDEEGDALLLGITDLATETRDFDFIKELKLKRDSGDIKSKYTKFRNGIDDLYNNEYNEEFRENTFEENADAFEEGAVRNLNSVINSIHTKHESRISRQDMLIIRDNLKTISKHIFGTEFDEDADRWNGVNRMVNGGSQGTYILLDEGLALKNGIIDLANNEINKEGLHNLKDRRDDDEFTVDILARKYRRFRNGIDDLYNNEYKD